MTLWYGTVGGIGDIIYPTSGGTSIDRFPLMQPWGESPPQKGGLNSDGTQIAPADAAIVLELAASDRWNPAADINDDKQVTSPGRAHDPAGGGWELGSGFKKALSYVD